MRTRTLKQMELRAGQGRTCEHSRLCHGASGAVRVSPAAGGASPAPAWHLCSALGKPSRAPKAQPAQSDLSNTGNEAAFGALFFQSGVQLDGLMKFSSPQRCWHIISHPGPFSLRSLVLSVVEGRDEPNPSGHMGWHPKVTLAQSPPSKLEKFE